MTKAAVASMVRGVALDLAPRRITVNNVQPGPTETDMTATMVSRLKEIVPLKRVGEPGEIAALGVISGGPGIRLYDRRQSHYRWWLRAVEARR